MEIKKAVAYHGVQNMAFAARKAGVYEAPFKLPYAQSINPTALLEAAEQYADNRLLCRVPNDKGYEGEVGTTAPDPNLEMAAGYMLQGASGLITGNVVNYMRGALYYEYIEQDEDNTQSAVKVWMFNVEIGKGSETHTTDKASIEFGAYSYPFRTYGESVMSVDGDTEYLDERGMGRTAYLYTARPGDAGYADFGKTVPVPKVAAPAAP